MEQERPKVGIGVIVRKGDKILIGERLHGHGSSTFMIPGGHLESGETFEETAKREVEETGLKNIIIRGLVSVGNDREYEKHYVSIGILADWTEGEAYNAEPEKAKNWYWGDPRSLPEPFFKMSKKVVENWLAGKIYTD